MFSFIFAGKMLWITKDKAECALLPMGSAAQSEAWRGGNSTGGPAVQIITLRSFTFMYCSQTVLVYIIEVPPPYKLYRKTNKSNGVDELTSVQIHVAGTLCTT